MHQIANGKIIRRIVVIDERLLLTENQLVAENRFLSDIDVQNWKVERQYLEEVVDDFHKSEFFQFDRYDQNLITLFYCVHPNKLLQLTEQLASVILLSQDMADMMILQTKGFKEPSVKNSLLDIAYFDTGKIFKPNNRPKEFDVKKIIQMLSVNKSEIRYAQPKNKPFEEIIVYAKIIEVYQNIFSQIPVGRKQLLIDGKGFYTINSMYSILKNQHQ